jgi:hypothetical protein
MDKRSAASRATSQLMAASASDAPVEPRTEVRCKVCSAGEGDLPNGAAVRGLADQLVMVPKPYPEVLRLLSPLMAEWPADAKFSKYSLRRHATRHLRWEEASFRAIADRRASQVARVGEAAERMLDATVVLETIRQRGVDLLLQDEIRPNVRDLLAATSALQELEEQAEGGYSTVDLLAQLDVVIAVIREEVPQDLWPRILARLNHERDSLPRPPEPDPLFEELLKDQERCAMEE